MTVDDFEVEDEGNRDKPKFFPQLVAALAANLGALTLGAGIGWSSPATPQLQDQYTKSELALVGALLNLGAMFGAVSGGFLVNRLGRRRLLILMAPVYIIGFILIGLASNLAMLIIGRILSGLGGGVVSVAASIYTAEISSPEFRGAFGSFFTLMIVVGILLVYIIGAVVNWWVLAFISIAFPVCFAVAMCFVPESPTYLISRDSEAEAKRSLIWLRGDSYPIELELADTKKNVELARLKTVGLKDLLVPTVMKPLFLGVALMFFQQMCGINAALYNLASIFDAAGGDIDSNVQAIIVGSVQLVATVAATLLADRAGRKLLLSLSGFLMGISLTGLGTYFFIQTNDPVTAAGLGWLPLASLIVFIVFYSVGFGPLPWAVMGEVLPGHVKGIISSVISGFSWGSAFIITLTFELMVQGIGQYGAFWLFAGFSFLAGLHVILFLPETKGKTLEEVQKFFE